MNWFLPLLLALLALSVPAVAVAAAWFEATLQELRK